jgi:hypothetical protein
MKPEINIFYSRLIDPIFVFYCQNNPDLKRLGWNDWSPPPVEEVLRRVRIFKDEWSKLEDKILTGMSTISGLNFRGRVIDVHVVSGNPRQMSNPMIMSSALPVGDFINTLIHELIHRLFGINKLGKVDDYLPEKYSSETETVRKHVIVHAILKHIYLDILAEPNRLKENMESCKKHKTNDYVRSWEITDELDYMEVIEMFKNKYAIKNE